MSTVTDVRAELSGIQSLLSKIRAEASKDDSEWSDVVDAAINASAHVDVVGNYLHEIQSQIEANPDTANRHIVEQLRLVIESSRPAMVIGDDHLQELAVRVSDRLVKMPTTLGRVDQDQLVERIRSTMADLTTIVTDADVNKVIDKIDTCYERLAERVDDNFDDIAIDIDAEEIGKIVTGVNNDLIHRGVVSNGRIFMIARWMWVVSILGGWLGYTGRLAAFADLVRQAVNLLLTAP